uniref:Ig-like domain-containing protein n=1 Tax=Anolis carolinensis TaxID=28377 RepID=H9GVZ3_ANOCA
MQYSVLSTGTMLPCLFLRWSLLLTTTGFIAMGAETLVQGKIGQDITLPCHYSVLKHGVTTMCWGRGSCPSSLCFDPIIWTDTSQEIVPKSSRYHLMGDIRHGDVSLTILNVTAKDAGEYCCRVEIPGWFNDLKIHVRTVIEKGSSGPTSLMVPGKSFCYLKQEVSLF